MRPASSFIQPGAGGLAFSSTKQARAEAAHGLLIPPHSMSSTNFVLSRCACFPIPSLPPFVCIALILSGCSVHRIDFSPAPAKTGPAFKVGENAAIHKAESAWWEGWEDPALDALIKSALTENLDVAANRERVEQALANYRRAGSAFGPALNLDMDLQREVDARGRPKRGTSRQAGLSADWEVDLFGRIGGIRTARGAESWARWHEMQDFRLRLSADIAETYVGIVEQRLLLSLLDDQMRTANELLNIIDQRYREGLISQLDVLQQQAQLTELEGQIPVAKAALEDLQSLLGALLGASPADFRSAEAGARAMLPSIAPLAPLENVDLLLLDRPDLRAAQAMLVAADADTARALAERLPRLTLTADALHVEASGPAASTLSVGAELIQPLLDWGARRAEWNRAQSVYRERLASFSQAYLRSLWQVDALVKNEVRQRELLQSLAKRRSLLEATIRQARNRYDSGLTDYLPVLSATQQLYALEQRQVREQRRLASQRIALHRALGGPVPADPRHPRPPPLADSRATRSVRSD
jgi:NodT family efflux transporter outer membrane factor (OMF) lipoprotein